MLRHVCTAPDCFGGVQEVHKHRDKFCQAQQPRLDALQRFTKQQRLARQQVGRTGQHEMSKALLFS